jgi:hypothetical protein
VSDRAVRDLERAVHGGDAAALPALVAAYLRSGASAAAIAALGDRRDLPPDLLALAAAGWRAALGALEPRFRLRAVRAYDRLLGWTGPDHAALALTGPDPEHARLCFFDRRTHVFVEAAQRFAWFGPATRRGLLAGMRRPGTPVRPHLVWLEGGALRLEALATPTSYDEALAAEPGCESVVWGAGLGRGAAWGQDRPIWWLDAQGTRLSPEWLEASAVAIDATRRRLVVGSGDEVCALEPGRDEPIRRVALRRGAADFTLLPDGRVVVPAPLRLVDLDAGSVTPLGRPGEFTVAPFALSRDARAVLAAGRREPVRLECAGGLGANTRHVLFTDSHWHPHADAIVALMGGASPTALWAFGEDGRPERLLTLPPDARPLGWSPDGRTLLVVRQVGAGGLLESWEGRA